jgi:hypothetical protein
MIQKKYRKQNTSACIGVALVLLILPFLSKKILGGLDGFAII